LSSTKGAVDDKHSELESERFIGRFQKLQHQGAHPEACSKLESQLHISLTSLELGKMADAAWTIKVMFTSGGGEGSLSLTSGGATTLAQLKAAITEQLKKGVKRVIFQGKVLNNDAQTLAEAKVQNGHSVHVQPDAAAAPAVPAPAAAAAAAAPAAAAAAPPQRSAAPVAAAVPQPVRAAVSPMTAAIARILQQPPAAAQNLLNTLLKVNYTALPFTKPLHPHADDTVPIDIYAHSHLIVNLCIFLQIVDNIIQHPLEEKYRSIKRSNKSFAARVGSVPGSDACMTALGFTLSQDRENWVLVPSATAWPTLQAGRANIQSAIAAATASSATAGAASASAFGSRMPQSPADMAAAMAVLNNPSAMQAMMQNRMVQRMMAADPVSNIYRSKELFTVCTYFGAVTLYAYLCCMTPFYSIES
jgi:PUB domain/Ubiquitin family